MQCALQQVKSHGACRVNRSEPAGEPGRRRSHEAMVVRSSAGPRPEAPRDREKPGPWQPEGAGLDAPEGQVEVDRSLPCPRCPASRSTPRTGPHLDVAARGDRCDRPRARRRGALARRTCSPAPAQQLDAGVDGGRRAPAQRRPPAGGQPHYQEGRDDRYLRAGSGRVTRPSATAQSIVRSNVSVTGV
jgi:hypothetical protein